ncbi:MAG TPA: molybdopterin converting factor subunit 1 [Dehalococcoidia bacterium]|nr:molybdopterin converting factor subunit 1 [Dehalococcoidia bacterium]
MTTARVRLFARLADLAGTRETEVELGEGLTAGEVLTQLVVGYPALEGLAGSVRFAVNAEYVPSTHPIGEGDEVALIPPVSGGANAV